MESFLIECITSSLKLYMYRNATFLCERLYAEFPSENNLHFLATCYFRSDQAYHAYHLLKGTKSVQSRYLFALACFEMGNLVEAETTLLPPGETGIEVPNGAAGYYMLGLICRYTGRRQAAIGHYTHALSLDPFFWSAYEDLCLLGADEEAASFYGDLAILHLQRQQFQSESRVQHFPHGDNSDSGSGMQSNRSPYSNDGSPKQGKSNSAGDFVGEGTASTLLGGTSSMHTAFAGSLSSYSTPSPSSSQFPAGPSALNRSMYGLSGSVIGAVGIPSHSPGQVGDISPRGVNAPGQPQRRKVMDEGKSRKSIRSPSTRAAYSQVSGRLFSEPLPRRSTRLLGDSNTTSGQLNAGGCSGSSVPGAPMVGGNGSGLQAVPMAPTRSGAAMTSRSSTMRKGFAATTEITFDDARRTGEAIDESGNDEFGMSNRCNLSTGLEDEFHNHSRATTGSGVIMRGKRQAEGAMELLALFRILGEAFRHLCMFRCQEALQSFIKLPQQQYATGWVLCQVGRAHFEMVDYREAERAFSWARRVSPCRLEGMDIYSTVLYHMKKEVDLSYLAQETVAVDRMSPQAWCVMGNCFSLQKDHETALKFFQRAIQLDQHFTYAHTLCGHEYVALEDFEGGLACYRSAIRLDARHYNAWYGLGTIYFRQEKFEFAEYHFGRALSINKRSSVLQCYLGMALHALKMNGDALALLEQAIASDPKNPLPKYQKANVLMSEERNHDALAELDQLKEIAPRESSVFFLMGKIYKRLNMPEQAMHHFYLALDLKPSTADVNLIKTAIEKLHVPDDLEEENL